MHLHWLAREAALAVKHGSCKMNVLLRCLEKQKDVEIDLFNVFCAELHAAEYIHHVQHADRRVFTDQCNTENLCRFLWDYLTNWNVPRFREFFNNTPTAQLYDVAGFDPSIAYGIVFDSSKQTGKPASRLVIYSIVMPAADAYAQWRLRRRQAKDAVLRLVVEHIDMHLAVIVEGIVLSDVTKYVANNVFDENANGVSLVRHVLRDTMSASAPVCKEDEEAAEKTASLLREEEERCLTTNKEAKPSKRKRRRVRRCTAAETIRRHSTAFLARIARQRRAASVVQTAYRRRQLAQDESYRDDEDAAFANKLAKDELLDQKATLQEIEYECLHAECHAVLNDVCARVETEAEEGLANTAACVKILDDIVASAARLAGKSAIQRAHRRMQCIQTSCGSLATVCATLHGQMYQLHVPKTSALATMVDDDDGSLAAQLVAATQDELKRLFAPRVSLD